MSNYKSGYLAVYLGPVQAEKTVFATKEATKYADKGEKVLYINNKLDDRETEGGDGSKFSSHSSSNKHLSDKVDATSAIYLDEVDVKDYSVIVVDEGQFYDDIVSAVLTWVDTLHKHVIVVGLDGSYKRTKIGNVLDLLPDADHFEKLPGTCRLCAGEREDAPIHLKYIPAPFSMMEDRVNKSNNEIMRPNESFISVCRYHHNMYNK